MSIKNLKKGTYGYINAYRRVRLHISLLWAGIIAALFIAGLIIFKTKLNFVTMAAVLLVLPAAKAWIAMIVMLPYRSDDKSRYDCIQAMMEGKTAEVFSDIVLTRYEGSMMLSVVVCYNDNLFAYAPKQKKSTAEIKKYLDEIIANAGLSTKSKVYGDFGKYKAAIEALAAKEDIKGKNMKALKEQLFIPAV